MNEPASWRRRHPSRAEKVTRHLDMWNVQMASAKMAMIKEYLHQDPPCRLKAVKCYSQLIMVGCVNHQSICQLIVERLQQAAPGNIT